MKHTALSIALAAGMLATPAAAGSLSDPVISAPTIVADATSSSSGTALVALLAILMSIPVLD